METTTQQTDVSLDELTLSADGLTDILMDLPRRAQFVTFTSETTPRMRKTVDGRGTPYNEFHDENGNCLVTKVSRVNGIINFRYKNSVNNQREREQGPDHEPFEPEPRKWGERLEGMPLVEHKGRYYLEVKVERSLGTTYLDENGDEIEREALEPYLYRSRQPSTQQTETPIILRDYRVENITEITVNGSTLEIS